MKHNILKVMKLDCSVMTMDFRTVILILIIPVFFTAMNRSLITGVSFAVTTIAMTTSYIFAYSEKNEMDRLYGILPVKKSHLVLGRYFFIIGMGVLDLIFSIIIQSLVLMLLGKQVSALDLTAAVIVGSLLFTLYTAFQLPGYYKLGSIKGRVFIYIPMAVFLVLLVLFAKFPMSDSVKLTDFLNAPFILLGAVLILIAVLYAISIRVSIQILKAKEG